VPERKGLLHRDKSFEQRYISSLPDLNDPDLKLSLLEKAAAEKGDDYII